MIFLQDDEQPGQLLKNEKTFPENVIYTEIFNSKKIGINDEGTLKCFYKRN